MSDEHAIDAYDAADPDLFLGACGLAGPMRLEVEHAEGGEAERRAYHRPSVLIGRSEGADLRLEHPRVGRRHALLQAIGGRVFCLDLESRTGTRREGGGEATGWLAPGGAIRVGPFTVRLRAGGDGGGPEEPGSPIEPGGLDHLGLPPVCLEFPGRKVAMPPWPMDRALALVGRSRACKVRLSGRDVSSIHGALVRTPVGLWAVDLLGRGGIAIDGRPARRGRLGEGGELEIGPHRIRVRYGGAGDLAGEARWMLPSPPVGFPGLAPMPAAPAPAPAPDVGELLAGRPPEQVALAESLLGPLMEQMHRSQQRALGQLQQQMFDQFQQVLMVVLQMFGRMHRDQMDLVREELDQIRRVTAELHAAQDEARRLGAAPRPDAAPTPGPPPRRAEPRADAGRREDAEAPGAARAPAATPPRPAAAPARGGRAPGADAGGRPMDPAELHAMLARRVAALQRDQQGHWQKLLSLVAGGGR